MGHTNVDLPVASIVAVLFGAALVAASLLSPATNVAQAQNEPATAANGVVLPPLDFDPAAARNEALAESVVAPATPTPTTDPADASTVTAAPEAAADAPVDATDAPESGNSVTTSLGGSDVAVSSVGGSHEVDRPKKRSERKN